MTSRTVRVTATACTAIVAFTLGACKPKSDRSAADAQECEAASKRVNEATENGPNAIRRADTPRTRLQEVRDDAARGTEACERAKLEDKATMLRAFRDALDQRLANAQASSTAAPSAVPIDPASCPKGRVMIDSATGKSVHCTGAASAGTTATSDDDDVRSSCARVKNVWKRSDGIEPIIDCAMEDGTHRDVKVVVTNAGWDYLGEHGKRRAFAQSVVDSFRSHWKKIHSWDGSEPAQRQVHLYRKKGADAELAALASASGFYRE